MSVHEARRCPWKTQLTEIPVASSAQTSRRRSLTSSLLAARAVSPARRRLLDSMNSLDQV